LARASPALAGLLGQRPRAGQRSESKAAAMSDAGVEYGRLIGPVSAGRCCSSGIWATRPIVTADEDADAGRGGEQSATPLWLSGDTERRA